MQYRALQENHPQQFNKFLLSGKWLTICLPKGSSEFLFAELSLSQPLSFLTFPFPIFSLDLLELGEYVNS